MDILKDLTQLVSRGKRRIVFAVAAALLILGTLGCSAEEEAPEDKIKDIDFTVVGEISSRIP